MTKAKKITLIVLAVVLVVTTAFFFLTKNENFVNKITGTIDTSSGATLDTLSPAFCSTDYPLVQTEQKDIFYEAFPDGTFKFYKFADGTFTQVTEGVTTKDVTITCSYQKVKVKLHYLTTDAGTVGYGLFNSKQESDTKFLSYVFVRMMDCPKAYTSTAKTDYILLTDMDAEDVYKPDKTYSDMYSYDMKSGKTSLVISQRDRLVQDDGTVREDWTIFTDTMLNNNDKHDLFASRRNYDTSAEASVIYDLLTVKNSRATNKNSATTVTGSPSYIVREKDGAYYCFANTEEGFDLIKNGDKKNPVTSFEGSFSDYAVSGNYILSKATLDLTDITSGETSELTKANFTELSGFCVNPSASKAVLFCNGDQQSLLIFDTATGDADIVTDSLFDNGICNFCFIDDSTVLFSTYDENGAAKNITVKI
ncbi:MAG: hypothetical protein J6L62_01620 [Clostridia bacterium]|nr:hypothetical protein [Clostridia bacterium]